MCFKPPKAPKEDPNVKRQREAQLREEAERMRKLKEDQLEITRGGLSGGGARSLITASSGSGYGRNFF